MLATLLLSAVLAAPPASPAAKEKSEPKLDAAVEAAAREFRIEIYERFREQRNEFDARRAMGNELLKAWNRADQPAAHRDAILTWFDEAKRRSKEGNKLAHYAGLEDLKFQIAEQESAAVAAALTDEENVKLPPPFIVDVPATGETGTSVESIFTRVKALFSGAQKSEPAAAPSK